MPGAVLIWLVVGAIAGWLAGTRVGGGGLGLTGDVATGIIGAFLGSLVLPTLGATICAWFISAIASAMLGAVLLLAITRLARS